MPRLAGRSHRAHRGFVAALCLAVLAGLAPGASAGAQGAAWGGVQGSGAGPTVTVMTRNLYLGADLLAAVPATNEAELEKAVAGIFSQVQYTDFPARAKLLAREIATAAPVLVGLQEAPLWFSGPLRDPAPATRVEYDFIEILRTELAAIGAPYDLVGAQPETDIEAPAGAPYSRDIRMLNRDAILVQAGADVRLSNVRSGSFLTMLPLPAGGRLFVSRRGWISVDAIVASHSFRFVATHLEAYQSLMRSAQALELFAGAILGAPSGKVVLVGDFNSGPDQPELQNRLTFDLLKGLGLTDTWAAVNPGDPGFTSSFGPRLEEPTLEHRIDHVMTLGGIRATASKVTGNDPNEKTPSGLWPSDHAGVVATLAL